MQKSEDSLNNKVILDSLCFSKTTILIVIFLLSIIGIVAFSITLNKTKLGNNSRASEYRAPVKDGTTLCKEYFTNNLAKNIVNKAYINIMKESITFVQNKTTQLDKNLCNKNHYFFTNLKGSTDVLGFKGSCCLSDDPQKVVNNLIFEKNFCNANGQPPGSTSCEESKTDFFGAVINPCGKKSPYLKDTTISNPVQSSNWYNCLKSKADSSNKSVVLGVCCI